MQGFATAGTPVNLLWALLGCTIGTGIGVLPGIGPHGGGDAAADHAEGGADGVDDLFRRHLLRAMYGGSTTSILLNTPGESGVDGHGDGRQQDGQSGRAGAALATAAIGSFVAGTIATVLVTLFAPVVAELRGASLGRPGVLPC